MVCKASGKYYRKGMSLIEIMNMFPDDENAKKWVESPVGRKGNSVRTVVRQPERHHQTDGEHHPRGIDR